MSYSKRNSKEGPSIMSDSQSPCMFVRGNREEVLKTPDTFGNCQRPEFSLGVSQQMNKTTKAGL